jgi:hypothetical protein
MTPTDAKPETIDKAWELIEDGGIVLVRGRVFQTVSTDGAELHLTSPETCNCTGGLRGRYCYHSVAAAIFMELNTAVLPLAA